MTTSIYIALLALMLIALSIHTIKGRRQFGAGMGDAGHIEMRRRIRAQGNFAEYTPLFLLMLWASETAGLPAYGVHGFGIAFMAGRLMHAYSLLHHEVYQGEKLANNPIWRIRGMICTFSVVGVLAVILLIQRVILS
jgi:uncharacterized protein